MESKDQAVWNTIFSVVFLVLVAASFWSITGGGINFRWLYVLDTLDIALLSLATFRIVRLVTSDKIFAFVRNWFLDKQANGTYQKPDKGIRRTFAELIECLWCTGLWGGWFVVALYFMGDFGRFFVIILAISALGSFFQVLSQMIGRIGNNPTHTGVCS